MPSWFAKDNRRLRAGPWRDLTAPVLGGGCGPPRPPILGGSEARPPQPPFPTKEGGSAWWGDVGAGERTVPQNTKRSSPGGLFARFGYVKVPRALGERARWGGGGSLRGGSGG